MSKNGFHVTIGRKDYFGETLKICYEAGSPVPGIHALDQNVADTIQRNSPITEIVYRHQLNGEDNPPNLFLGNEIDIRNRATSWMTKMRDNWLLNPATYYSPINEPNPATLEEFHKLNIFMDQCIYLADSWGIKLCLPAFSTGTPSDDGGSTRYEKWNALIPSLIKMKTGGHTLNIHEYGFSTTLKESAPNHALRFISVYDFLVPRGADPNCIVTECSPYNGYSQNDEEFLDDLAWYDFQVMHGKYNQYIKWFCAYQLGGAENCYKLLPRFAEYISHTPTPVIPPPPPPEPGLPYIVTAHLAPQNSSLDIMYRVQSGAFDTRSTVCQSADDARYLVKAGKSGSKCIIYNPQSWPGGVDGISNFFSGLNIEFRYLSPINPSFRLKSPILDIPFRVTDIMDSPRSYGKHEGIDMDCYDETINRPVAIYACADGIVEKAGTDLTYPGYGNYIIIKHDFYGQTYKTWYCHLGQILVSTNSLVKAGTKIGVGGNSGTSAIHLHLNLQKIGGGLSGYIVPDVVNPLNYMDVPQQFKSGVGLGEAKVLNTAEKAALGISKVQSIKILTLPNYEDNVTLVSQVRNLSVVSRLFFSVNQGFNFTPKMFVDFCKVGLDAQYKSGIRYFEIHNEPNLISEGYGWNWATGKEFGYWLIEVLNILRSLYPEAKFGYPGLSPQPNTAQFFTDSKFAADQCDWVGTHAYWNSEGNTGWGMESIDGGMYWTRYLNWTDKPLYLTEFSNNNPAQNYTIKGQQYKRYFDLLKNSPLMAAFCFALSWTNDPNKEAWVVNNTITQIPYEVGA